MQQIPWGVQLRYPWLLRDADAQCVAEAGSHYSSAASELAGVVAVANCASDCYSLAMVIWELATCDYPYSSMRLHQVNSPHDASTTQIRQAAHHMRQ